MHYEHFFQTYRDLTKIRLKLNDFCDIIFGSHNFKHIWNYNLEIKHYSSDKPTYHNYSKANNIGSITFSAMFGLLKDNIEITNFLAKMNLMQNFY